MPWYHDEKKYKSCIVDERSKLRDNGITRKDYLEMTALFEQKDQALH